MQPSLAELERALAARILARESPGLDAQLRVPAGADVAARLAIHVEGYPARILASLREAFPALAQILGAATFAALAQRYARAIPAELRNLNRVGEALAAFLERDPASADLPFLAALAELEWAVQRCVHAEWLRAFDASACAGWTLDDWARARVRFQPGLALVCAPWPLRELRETRLRERSEIDVDLVDRSDRVLVYRRGFEVAVESIAPGEALALRWLRAGDALGAVAGRLAAAGEQSSDVTRCFERWARLGLVVGCETEGTAH
ncbi:MAG TPA: DNA-binding domain-containing protein [Myxococcota bacterium]|nr:DNA-binding domain-containing protein [Myxococcota bacterium]